MNFYSPTRKSILDNQSKKIIIKRPKITKFTNKNIKERKTIVNLNHSYRFRDLVH